VLSSCAPSSARPVARVVGHGVHDALHGASDQAAEPLDTGHDPVLVARFGQPVLATAQRVVRPLAVVSSASTPLAGADGSPG
jgi:hypothetical protein